jgi:hypothetical protein
MSTELTWLTFLLRVLQPAVHFWRDTQISKLCLYVIFPLIFTKLYKNRHQKYYVPKIRTLQSVSHASETRGVSKVRFVTERSRASCELSACKCVKGGMYAGVNVLWHVNALPGNRLVNKFPRRQILGKQSVARLRNNKGMSVNILKEPG